jgi:predicted DNA-binding transcriptional regulator AlpA
VPYLYKLCMRRAIPYWKSAGGKMSYFDRNEIDDWAKHRRIKTSAEIESEAAAYLVTGKK